MDMSQYRTLFITESREHLRSLNDLIVELEKDAANREHIDAVFRAAHSLKGMAASMEYSDIATLAHKMEDLMERVRKGALAFDGGIADLLLEGADLLEAMITDVEHDVRERRNAAGLVQRLTDYAPKSVDVVKPHLPSAETPASPSPPAQPDIKLRRHDDVQKAQGDIQQTVRVKSERLNHLANLTGELITNKYRLLSISNGLDSDRLDDALAELAKLLRSLCDEVMQLRMMPFSAITDRFPRIIRDLAKKSDKEVAFTMEENSIELDRGILENLADPLIHILRNAVDHGIERKEERLAAGKPLKGNIRLAVRRDKDQVIISITDDGRGMDPLALAAAAVTKGFLTPDEARRLSPRQALLLICTPGFSTAAEVTDISGRGVGMDAVRSAVQSLGGEILIAAEVGQGSQITLKLPLTIAIIQALIVECARMKVAVPVTSIMRTVELSKHQIVTSGKRKTFNLGEESIPLVSLNRILGRPPVRFTDSFIPVILCETKERKVGFVADRLLGHQELFVKPIGRPLDKLNGLSGGAILGDGEAVFILDIPNLV
jgi:two-component system chemotaxis sensor kinase CheA